MTPPAAISGNFADIKLVKTRSVVQMVIEIPIERAKDVTDAFGWPQPGSEIHVAVARLKTETVEKKRPPAQSRAELARRLCGVADFQDYLKERFYPGTSWQTLGNRYERASHWVKLECGIQSKSELDPPDGNATSYAPAEAWDRLYADFQQATGRMAERTR